ncbi:MAG: T9SS type A sorting domain-containing protein [Sphingobacteriales bacterium]|nr:MAG: T9SS type A sorting domain-containing protein [Sphingobacteriales bacterium]
MTKKILLLTLVFFLGLSFWNNQYVHTNSAQPPLGRTGAPGELTCAGVGCHGGAPNTGPGSVNIFFAGAGSGLFYYPDSTYVIGLTVNNGGGSGIRYGFEMVALNSSNQSVGTFIGNTPNFTGTASQSSRQYIFHKNIPNPNSGNYTFQWTAPSSNVGAITFYAAGNSANGNGAESGDLIYTKTLTINGLSVGIEDAAQPNHHFSAFPNPITENTVGVQYILSGNVQVKIALYDLKGQLLETLFDGEKTAGHHQQQLTLNKELFPEGMYLISLQTDNGALQTQKVWIQ